MDGQAHPAPQRGSLHHPLLIRRRVLAYYPPSSHHSYNLVSAGLHGVPGDGGLPPLPSFPWYPRGGGLTGDPGSAGRGGVSITDENRVLWHEEPATRRRRGAPAITVVLGRDLRAEHAAACELLFYSLLWIPCGLAFLRRPEGGGGFTRRGDVVVVRVDSGNEKGRVGRANPHRGGAVSGPSSPGRPGPGYRGLLASRRVRRKEPATLLDGGLGCEVGFTRSMHVGHLGCRPSSSRGGVSPSLLG